MASGDAWRRHGGVAAAIGASRRVLLFWQATGVCRCWRERTKHDRGSREIAKRHGHDREQDQKATQQPHGAKHTRGLPER
jgi:hypothetical protein